VNIFIQAAIARRVDKPITKSSNNRSLHHLPAIFFMNIPPQSQVSSPPVPCIALARLSWYSDHRRGKLTATSISPSIALRVTLGVMRDLLFYC